MQTTLEITNGTSRGFSVFNLGRLLVIPAMALTLMLALTLGSAGQPSTPAQAGIVEPSLRQADEAYTLYIYTSDSIYAWGLDLAEQVRTEGDGKPLDNWYARVDSPADEAELMKAWDHANWIRSDLGLPAIALVDLRLP